MRRIFDTSKSVIPCDKQPLIFSDAQLHMMLERHELGALSTVPGLQYWCVGENRKMSLSENITGYVQRAWEYYWSIRLGVQTGNVCLGIGTGSVGAPGLLPTDKFNGTSPDPTRYPAPNENSHMQLDADELPWQFFSNKFGGVIFNHSFEHLLYQDKVLKEALRITIVGGCVCILQPDMSKNARGSIDPTHTHEWSGDEFYAWLHDVSKFPNIEIVAHNTLDNDFSFDTVIKKTGE